jgi:hypothetical protein
MSRRDEKVPLPPVPVSVFYPGRRRGRCYSFRPTHETQAKIERHRHRKPRSK